MGKKHYDKPRREAPGEMDFWAQVNEARKSLNMEPAKERPQEDEKQTQHYGGNTGRNGQKPPEGKGKNQAQRLPLNQGPHAPYNFVPINNRVMEAETIPGHNEIAGDGLYTGYLHYSLTAQTPIMVANKQGDFYRNKDGRFALPGSTMRGLIRSNLQLLSFSAYQDDIDNYNLMYRAVAGGALRGSYSKVLGEKGVVVNGHRMTVLQNVRAGYIGCRGKEYYLYRNVGDSDHTFKNDEADYYAVSERYVLEKARGQFAYLIDKFQNRGPFVKRPDTRGRIHYIGKAMPSYKPYYEEITYKLSNNRVYSIQKSGLNRRGYVMSTGRMNEKKVFYVIPERDINDPGTRIPQESVTAFQIDLKSRENTIDKNYRDFYRLPEDGQIRPVFYIELGGRLYFGYTPRLRLMYDHTIQEGLRQQDASCDYAKAIFGYSNGESSLKSRVYFTDAALTNQAYPQKEVRLVLGEPKPTSYLEYLEQKDGQSVKTYNEDFRLRGVKQYWLQENTSTGAEPVKNEAVSSKFMPLEAGSQFAGNIRFQNLTKEELGLLIWSIRLERDSQMNVGKAKAYGYGRIKMDSVTLHLLNADRAYEADSAVFGMDPYQEQTEEERDSFVDAYKDQLAKWLNVGSREKVMEHATIRDFFFMKSSLADQRTSSFMTLKEYTDFKQRNNPLPTVGEIMSDKMRRQAEEQDG